MKKLILILLIVFATGMLLNGSSNIVSNNYDIKSTELFNRIITLTAKDLNLDTTGLRIFVSQSKYNAKMTKEIGAITFADSIYSINMDEGLTKTFLIKIFLHELVHIAQIQQKRLLIMKVNVWFEGEIYSGNVPHDERKYEKEAMNKSNELLWKFHKNIYIKINDLNVDIRNNLLS